MQAELENLKFIAVLGIIHGALEDLVSYIFHVILKRKSAPWGSFRTPRRERLMADIVIISMFSESIGIVCVNGLLYVYQFIYLQNISLLKLVQFRWLLNGFSPAYPWPLRRLLVAITNLVPLAIWTATNLLEVVHGLFDES